MALTIVASIVSVFVLGMYLISRYRHKQIAAIADAWLNLPGSPVFWPHLYDRGWRREHVQYVADLFIDPAARTQDRGLSLAVADRIKAWQFLTAAGSNRIPGTRPEHHITWILAATEWDNARQEWRYKPLTGPGHAAAVQRPHADVVTGQMREWDAMFGPGLAPLIAAAGVPWDEALTARRDDTLTEAQLRTLIAMRGDRVPAYPATPR